MEFYPDFATKAAVLCVRIAKNHPLPDGNKRVAFVCMVEFCLVNGFDWMPPPGDEDGEASTQVILDVAAGPGDDQAVAELGGWIRARIGLHSDSDREGAG